MPRHSRPTADPRARPRGLATCPDVRRRVSGATPQPGVRRRLRRRVRERRGFRPGPPGASAGTRGAQGRPAPRGPAQPAGPAPARPTHRPRPAWPRPPLSPAPRGPDVARCGQGEGAAQERVSGKTPSSSAAGTAPSPRQDAFSLVATAALSRLSGERTASQEKTNRRTTARAPRAPGPAEAFPGVTPCVTAARPGVAPPAHAGPRAGPGRGPGRLSLAAASQLRGRPRRACGPQLATAVW